jgi:hypothetical protein
VPDDRDVDADGDGLIDDMPPAEVVEAAWVGVQTECRWAAQCCSMVVQSFSSEEDLPACHEGQLGGLLVDFAQAAATAGATVDAEAWLAEKRSEVPWEGGGLNCPDYAVEKGQQTRRETIDGLLLPWFHGTTPIGDACFTLWDCAVEGRCEGLVQGSGEPGTCAIRPYEGGPCAGSEPYCLVGNTCNVSESSSVCERPRDENEFCSAFELGGRRTDNCSAEQWCDIDFVTPACRPVLRVGDPCTEDRQCIAFACTDEGDGPACPPFQDWFQTMREMMRDWCHEQLPTTEPAEGI